MIPVWPSLAAWKMDISMFHGPAAMGDVFMSLAHVTNEGHVDVNCDKNVEV